MRAISKRRSTIISRTKRDKAGADPGCCFAKAVSPSSSAWRFLSVCTVLREVALSFGTGTISEIVAEGMLIIG
jgi:hypothetical protein